MRNVMFQVTKNLREIVTITHILADSFELSSFNDKEGRKNAVLLQNCYASLTLSVNMSPI